MVRPVAYLTIDLEDYRRQELRDHLRPDEPAHPREVERQLDRVLELLDACDAHATFFAVGRLVGELASGAWREISDRHRVGCHGFEHLRVGPLGPVGFGRELRLAKGALEDVTGREVLSHRAPYFSADGCDPWFGAVLAREGFRIDSSRRLRGGPPGFTGVMPLAGGDGAVIEVPLPALGFGGKRLTVIGGTYFRLLPLPAIVGLLRRGQALGFRPMVYLHPYDLDPGAEALGYGRLGHWRSRMGDRIRRIGRVTAAEKVRALAKLFEFRPVEDLLVSPAEMAGGPGREVVVRPA